MKHSLETIYRIITEAGIGDPAGFPLRAALATIAVGEGGDPNAWVEHDPPRDPLAPPSSGLYQVHRRAWPKIYEEMETIRRAPLSDREKILAMTLLVRPIALHMLEAAFRATQILADRGLPISRLNTALFMDAAWQTGAEGLYEWARRTRSGNPREIVNAPRSLAAEVSLRQLAGDALEASVPSAGLLLGALLALVLVGYALSHWETA